MRLTDWFRPRPPRDLSKLTTFQREVPSGSWMMILDVLERAAQAFDARAVMAWEEDEEPWLYVASLDRGQFNWTREPPTEFEPLVDPALASASFYSPDATATRPAAVLQSDGNRSAHRGPLLHGGLVARFSVRSVLSAPIGGETWRGRIFLLDVRRLSDPDLTAVTVAASLISNRLEQIHLREQLQEAAATDERLRIARDLHDGVLQRFTGIALQLQAAERLVMISPAAAVEALNHIKDMLEKEQRNLRGFIRRLRPTTTAVSGTLFDLSALLHETQYRVQRQWDVDVDLQLNFNQEKIPPPLRLEIQHLVHEAVMNAARHAKPSRVTIELTTEDHSARIVVTDDGKGFPFSGRFDAAALETSRIGPRSIRERVVELEGSLVLETGPTGTRIEITLPLKRPPPV